MIKRENEKREYTTIHNAFIGILNDWRQRNLDKMLLFEGKPQNLLDTTFLADCQYLIIPCRSVNSISGVEYNINSAAIAELPLDRLIVSVETTSLDETDTTTGYINSGESSAILEISKFVAGSNLDYTLSGMMIYNVGNDYHNPVRVYDQTRKAMNNINPSIKN